MKIISFAHTTDLLLAGKKTETRREWNDDYARRFKAGDLVQAYDHSPRAGGKKVAVLKLTHDPYKERLCDMTDESEIREGGVWGSAAEYIEAQGGDPNREMWVVRFEVVKFVSL